MAEYKKILIAVDLTEQSEHVVSRGIALARPADEIIIANVVRDMEDDLNLVECFCKGGKCLSKPVCELKSILTQALKAYVRTLEKYTLKDLLRSRNELEQILGITA